MRKIVLTAITLLLFSRAVCQDQDSIPKIMFGFNLGLNYSNTQIKNVDPAGQSTNSIGYRMGVLMDWRFTNHLSLSPKAELSFNNSKVTVLKSPDEKNIYQVYPVLMELAIHANYKINNNRTIPYILFGPSCKVPLTGDKKVRYATERSDLALDFGVGLDRKLTYFNIAPELRYSFGLTNLSGINAVDRLYYHSIVLVLNFKG
jgi:hypothetical protein